MSRQRTTLRASWTAEDLEEAREKVKKQELGVNEASRVYGIPSRTLRRYIISGRSKGPLGRTPVFSTEHEKKLVAHIKRLEKVGFAPDRKDVKEMAFQLAQKLNLNTPFSKNSECAGNVWFTGFMKRNRELSQRKSEGLSLARAYGVNREDVKDFFDLLAKIYEDNDFANHPEDIYNMDESGIQVNNKPGKVVATKGAKDVYTLTSCEKGENVTVIACCNAQGNFIPPVLIYKGTYSKPQFSEGLPPGSQVFMNKKSSYINSDLFMKWFEEVFLRHKSSRKTLLVLDGHSSHSNNIQLLEVAKENNVILLCLPSHTTHALQPLDRAFFNPLKVYFSQEAKAWMVRNKDKKLTRYDVSKLIGAAWGKAATISNGVSALKTCGIYPFNPNAIPDHYFSMSDSLREQNLVENVANDEDDTSRESITLLQEPLTTMNMFIESQQQFELHCEEQSRNVLVTTATIPSSPNEPLSSGDHISLVTTATVHSPPRQHFQQVEACSGGPAVNSSGEVIDTSIESATFHPKPPQKDIEQLQKRDDSLSKEKNKTSRDMDLIEILTSEKIPSYLPKDTPSKILSEIHPVPKLPSVLSKRKQKAVILTSDDYMEKKKLITNKKQQKEARKKQKDKTGNKRKIKTNNYEKKDEDKKRKPNKKHSKIQRKKKKIEYSSSESNDENITDVSEEEVSDEETNKCAECTENYFQTKSTEDWIQCTSCYVWLHEFCTMYNPLCNRCGRIAKRDAINKKQLDF